MDALKKYKLQRLCVQQISHYNINSTLVQRQQCLKAARTVPACAAGIVNFKAGHVAGKRKEDTYVR